MVGRTSGELRLIVCTDTQQTTITPKIEAYTEPVVVLYTDGSNAYGRVEKTGRSRRSVNHSEGEWARDADGNGLKEIHCNTMEGIWTGLRNFLRRFRGVHKKHLAQYVAIFEWEHNLKEVTGGFLRMLRTPASPSIQHEPYLFRPLSNADRPPSRRQTVLFPPPFPALLGSCA